MSNNAASLHPLEAASSPLSPIFSPPLLPTQDERDLIASLSGAEGSRSTSPFIPSFSISGASGVAESNPNINNYTERPSNNNANNNFISESHPHHHIVQSHIQQNKSTTSTQNLLSDYHHRRDRNTTDTTTQLRDAATLHDDNKNEIESRNAEPLSTQNRLITDKTRIIAHSKSNELYAYNHHRNNNNNNENDIQLTSSSSNSKKYGENTTSPNEDARNKRNMALVSKIPLAEPSEILRVNCSSAQNAVDNVRASRNVENDTNLLSHNLAKSHVDKTRQAISAAVDNNSYGEDQRDINDQNSSSVTSRQKVGTRINLALLNYGIENNIIVDEYDNNDDMDKNNRNVNSDKSKNINIYKNNNNYNNGNQHQLSHSAVRNELFNNGVSASGKRGRLSPTNNASAQMMMFDRVVCDYDDNDNDEPENNKETSRGAAESYFNRWDDIFSKTLTTKKPFENNDNNDDMDDRLSSNSNNNNSLASSSSFHNSLQRRLHRNDRDAKRRRRYRDEKNMTREAYSTSYVDNNIDGPEINFEEPDDANNENNNNNNNSNSENSNNNNNNRNTSKQLQCLQSLLTVTTIKMRVNALFPNKNDEVCKAIEKSVTELLKPPFCYNATHVKKVWLVVQRQACSAHSPEEFMLKVLSNFFSKRLFAAFFEKEIIDNFLSSLNAACLFKYDDLLDLMKVTSTSTSEEFDVEAYVAKRQGKATENLIKLVGGLGFSVALNALHEWLEKREKKKMKKSSNNNETSSNLSETFSAVDATTAAAAEDVASVAPAATSTTNGGNFRDDVFEDILPRHANKNNIFQQHLKPTTFSYPTNDVTTQQQQQQQQRVPSKSLSSKRSFSMFTSKPVSEPIFSSLNRELKTREDIHDTTKMNAKRKCFDVDFDDKLRDNNGDYDETDHENDDNDEEEVVLSATPNCYNAGDSFDHHENGGGDDDDDDDEMIDREHSQPSLSAEENVHFTTDFYNSPNVPHVKHFDDDNNTIQQCQVVATAAKEQILFNNNNNNNHSPDIPLFF